MKLLNCCLQIVVWCTSVAQRNVDSHAFCWLFVCKLCTDSSGLALLYS